MKAAKKSRQIRWRIEYRDNGQWVQGNTFETREEAVHQPIRPGQGYRVVRVI